MSRKSAADIPAICDQVRHIAARGYEEAIEMLACIEVLEAGNEKQVLAGLKDQQALRAIGIIRTALFGHLLMLSMRPFDPVKKGDQHLAVAFELLKNEDIRDAVGQSGSPEDLDEAIRLFADLVRDQRKEKLRHTRNKELAHLSARDPNIPKPLIGETFAFVRDVARIEEKLASGTGACSIELRYQLSAYTEGSKAFWAPWRQPA